MLIGYMLLAVVSIPGVARAAAKRNVKCWPSDGDIGRLDAFLIAIVTLR
jgi:hypothetical protein